MKIFTLKKSKNQNLPIYNSCPNFGIKQFFSYLYYLILKIKFHKTTTTKFPIGLKINTLNVNQIQTQQAFFLQLQTCIILMLFVWAKNANFKSKPPTED
ncbi:hypothetical protein BpHYR1_026758 [Brachionus plicatilis]|uniref:Transmembrane protein n=1 Tax=Brachionus plicatilis TaxID=10195 RepID=A0A3M7R251_BRAPC|nr:hypothetical protein BpHYR1_026758 [Brachionus plicatilis]